MHSLQSETVNLNLKLKQASDTCLAPNYYGNPYAPFERAVYGLSRALLASVFI